MAEEKLLTVREVSVILGISERDVLDLAEKGAIPAYKVGGVYLRFKKEQVTEYRRLNKPVSHRHARSEKPSFSERLSEFFYFNDFYVLAGLIVAIVIYIIFKGY
jgi:excisionase family DNA binding protein